MVSVADLVAREAAGDEIARLERMRRAWSAYHGELPKPLSVRPGRTDDNVVLNYARLIVDKGASFLFGTGIGIEAIGGGPRGEEGAVGDAQAWLDAVWSANRQATLLHRLAVNGGVCGHAFVKILPGEALGALPRLVVVDPMTVTVSWTPDDWERITSYRLQWHGIDPTTGRARAFRQLITYRDLPSPCWTITDQRSDGDTPHWYTVRSVVWPHSWPPIVGCQNLPAPNEHWGVSDLEGDTIGVCRAMNFVLSNAARIIRLHAHPKLWGSGFSPEDLSLGPDDVTVLPARDAAIHLLEMRGDMSSSMELYRSLKEALHEMARIPEASMGGLRVSGNLSGAALRALHQPLIEKTRTKRLLYGDLIGELSRRLLAMRTGAADRAGAADGRSDAVRVVWPTLAATDAPEEVG